MSETPTPYERAGGLDALWTRLFEVSDTTLRTQGRVDAIDNRMGDVEHRLADVEQHLDQQDTFIKERFDDIDKKLQEVTTMAGVVGRLAQTVEAMRSNVTVIDLRTAQYASMEDHRRERWDRMEAQQKETWKALRDGFISVRTSVALPLLIAVIGAMLISQNKVASPIQNAAYVALGLVLLSFIGPPLLRATRRQRFDAYDYYAPPQPPPGPPDPQDSVYPSSDPRGPS